MISASQIIYVLRIKGTDIISYWQRKHNIKFRQSLKTQGVWHSAQMMSAFRQKSVGILCVFQGFGATKAALFGHYDECRTFLEVAFITSGR